jgi:hypothetical protein
MVLRLLAFNAEYWLADRLNAYLQDPDEYRAITRNLLHLGGQLTYTPHTITITLDRPEQPRVFRTGFLLVLCYFLAVQPSVVNFLRCAVSES